MTNSSTSDTYDGLCDYDLVERHRYEVLQRNYLGVAQYLIKAMESKDDAADSE